MDCDEVVPGLYIGDKAAISSTAFLSRQQITHVLNAAEGRDQGDGVLPVSVRFPQDVN